MADQEDARYEEILEKRARRLRAVPRPREQRPLSSTVAIGAVGSERRGVPGAGVCQIVKAPPVSPLPKLPAWIRGIAQVRGEIVCVVDTAAWFGIPAHALGYLLILQGPCGLLGLLVDSVVDFRAVHADEIVAGLSDAGSNRPVTGMTRDLVALVDLPRLFESPELSIHAEGAVRREG